jgi:SAM-dependent methyltransferase
VLEIGSGGGFSKTLLPGLITSEIIPVPVVDVVLDAQRLPFGADSLRGILMIDVFHHIPRVDAFLCEARRCVKPGGVVAMIEPWITPWSRFIYTCLHPEPCRPRAAAWDFPPGSPLSLSNQALPWIVFKRDRKRFESHYKHWRIAVLELHTPIAYLLSGGFSFPGLLPGKAHGVIKGLEKRLRPFNRWLAMFATIVLRRI